MATPLSVQTDPVKEHALVDVANTTAMIVAKGGKYPAPVVTKLLERLNYWCGMGSISPRTVIGMMLHETGWFTYGGDVQWWQFNLAGIGATGGVVGNIFTVWRDQPENLPKPTDKRSESNTLNPPWSDIDIDQSVENGVSAFVAHHAVYLYGTYDLWPLPIQHLRNNDPRYINVVQANLDGSVNKIQDYGGKWAVPGVGYGQRLVDIGNTLPTLEAAVPAPPPHHNFILPFPLKVDHIPWSNPNRSRQLATKPGRTYITIHETANYREGANALMHRNFVHNGGGAGEVLFTYCVDDHEAYELAPRGEKTWQASDGANGPGNSSVSIETCVNRDGNFNETLDNLADLVVWLVLNDSNLSVDRIVQHNYWAPDKKNCPTMLRANNNQGWNTLMQTIRDRYALAINHPPQNPNAAEINGFWIIDDIYHRWKSLGQLTLPMIGYPITHMFGAPIDGVMRDTQFFERGAMSVYEEGTADGVAVGNPFRVRMLVEREYHEAWEYGVEHEGIGTPDIEE